MTPIFRAGLAAALPFLLALPAHAQWQGGIGLSARDARHSEYDQGGRRLVREQGWLPGVTLDAGYRRGDLTWFGALEWYRHDIDYRGQTQGGAAAGSTTATGLAAVRLGGAWAIGDGYSVQAAFEADRWKRDIQSSGGSAGLQETYRSRRLVAGAGKAWQTAAGTVSADGAVVLSEPERLHVGFSGLLDPVSFDTHRAHGWRIGASLRPASVPWLELRARYDWMTVPRSGDADITRNGQFAGTVAQPEHKRQALTLTVGYRF